MRALRRSARMIAAITGAAALMAVTGTATSAQAAEGTFFYTRADTGRETFLGSTPNGQCLAVPGGARQAVNDTDTDARLYTNSSCTSSSRFLGSRQSDEYTAPYPTFVRFG
ncbi:hypothetical protein ACSNOK_10130 [Streptomyces sp. URMC 126]|uniref:hypothetical protein n=1 Tax=Streptomyces sp. URMC 126 TaxID=3423401 RepID=UPI003F1AB76B